MRRHDDKMQCQTIVLVHGAWHTLTQPIELTGSHARIANKSYVLATKNPLPLFQDFARAMRNDRSCISYELSCGHDVMIDLPKETAAIIEEAAARAITVTDG
jgi:hypothetical protein